MIEAHYLNSTESHQTLRNGKYSSVHTNNQEDSSRTNEGENGEHSSYGEQTTGGNKGRKGQKHNGRRRPGEVDGKEESSNDPSL